MGVPEGKQRNHRKGKKTCLTVALENDLFRWVEARSNALSRTKSAIVNEFLRVGIKEFCRRAEKQKQNKNK